jgi:molybdopterin synthase sulfur carrier subunit
MPSVRLPGPLKKLAGGRAEHRLPGATVTDVLVALAREEPATDGWLLDERGHLRPHISVFVNGERVAPEAPLDEADRVDVLQAISGG